jgi:hypothetical protein
MTAPTAELAYEITRRVQSAELLKVEKAASEATDTVIGIMKGEVPPDRVVLDALHVLNRTLGPERQHLIIEAGQPSEYVQALPGPS